MLVCKTDVYGNHREFTIIGTLPPMGHPDREAADAIIEGRAKDTMERNAALQRPKVRPAFLPDPQPLPMSAPTKAEIDQWRYRRLHDARRAAPYRYVLDGAPEAKKILHDSGLNHAIDSWMQADHHPSMPLGVDVRNPRIACDGCGGAEGVIVPSDGFIHSIYPPQWPAIWVCDGCISEKAINVIGATEPLLLRTR